jgi:hypothetical protein
MPYFVYMIVEMPIRRLKKLEQHESFREASNQAKLLRGELAGDASCVIKVIFAETELHAEDLLNQVRQAAAGPGDD